MRPPRGRGTQRHKPATEAAHGTDARWARRPRGGHAAERSSLLRARERGQASVELIALVPLGVVVTLTALQLLAAGAARELAGHAAGAGAVALLERADPRDAARDAVPGWGRERLTVTVRGSAVSVHVRPPTLVPGLVGLLETTVRAQAGGET